MIELKETLFVPIQVNALAINEKFKHKDVRRWRMNFFQMLRHHNPEPEPFHGEIEDGFLQKKKNWGVYLHWMVPAALRKAEEKDGAPDFRPLPNRWVVLRYDPEGKYTKSWLIKSDALDTPHSGGSTFAYVDKDGKIQITRLGQSAEIATSVDVQNEQNTFRKIGATFPKALNAVGYGDINFLAYQPLVNDVFSFHDTLPRDTDGNVVVAAKGWHYLVAGWFSDPADDILGQKDREMKSLLSQLKWTVAGKDEEYAQLKSSVYFGKLYHVKWHGADCVAEKEYSQMKVALGNNAIEAMAALLQHTSRGEIKPETLQFLKAFQYGELPLLDEAGGSLRLNQEIRKRWFKPQSGGTYWVIETNNDTRKDTVSDDAKKLLEQLNAKQAQKEEARRELRLQQKLLYDTWWQLNIKKNSIPSDSERSTNLQQEINGLSDGALAGKIKSLQRDVNQVLAEKDALVDMLKGTNFMLKESAAAPFWEVQDPTLLITGITPQEPFVLNEEVACLLAHQLTPQGTPSSIPWVNDRRLRALLEHYVAEVAQPPLEHGWKQPWKPLFLEWEAEWFALPYQTDQDKKWWHYDGSDYQFQKTTDDIEKKGWDKEHGYIVRGRNFLSPENNLILLRQLEELKKVTPEEKRTKLQSLDKFVTTLVTEKFLSQPLKDFNAQLRMHSSQLSLLPDKLKNLIGDEHRHQPFSPGKLPRDSQGIRQGQFKINKLLVYDGFGQCITLVGGHGIKNEKTFSPIKEQHLIPKEGTLVKRWNPDRFIELKPRMQEYVRLAFDFIDGSDTSKILNLNKDVNPICGWVVHNHIDKSLAYFNYQGQFIGETRIVQQVVETSIEGQHNEIFTDFVKKIPKDATGFEKFINLIDQTLWTIDAGTSLQEQHQAVWMGKPLALVRTRLQFESLEPLQADQADAPVSGELPNYLDPVYCKEKAQYFRSLKYAIKMGNQGIRQDGLIGYFYDGYFYSVNIRHQFMSDFIKPIQNDSLEVGFSAPVYVSLLMDPNASVFAQTGLLPYSNLRLSTRFVNEGLEKMQVHFRFHSLLTTVHKAGKPDQHDTVTLPFPALQSGSWYWEEKQAGKDKRVFPIQDVPGEASLTDDSALIRDGRLVFKGAE